MLEYYFRTSSSADGVELYLLGYYRAVHFVSADEFEKIASETGEPSIDRIFNSFLRSGGLEKEVNEAIKKIKKEGGRLVLNRDGNSIEWPYKLVVKE